MNWRVMGEMLESAPVPEVDKWKVAVLVAVWFGTDEQVAYAQRRYEQEYQKATMGGAG